MSGGNPVGKVVELGKVLDTGDTGKIKPRSLGGLFDEEGNFGAAWHGGNLEDRTTSYMPSFFTSSL